MLHACAVTVRQRLGTINRFARNGQRPRHRPAADLVEQLVEQRADLRRMLRQIRYQRPGIRQSVQPRHGLQRIAAGQAVGLAILHHLQAVLDRAQAAIGRRERVRICLRHEPLCHQCIQRIEQAAHAKRRFAPAMDQLLRLDEEFDLADAAPALLYIEGRTGLLRAVMLGPDPLGQRADFRDRPEIETAAPDERVDGRQKCLAGGYVARGCPRAQERRPLPRQGAAFVMGERGVFRNGQRADFGCRTQAQIDAEDVTLCGILGEQLHDLARVTLRRFARFVPFPPGQSLRLIQQDRIDVGTVIELPRAVLAQRQRIEAGRFGIIHPPGNGSEDRLRQRLVGKGGQLPCDRLEIEGPCQIADRQCQCDTEPLPPERGAGVLSRPAFLCRGESVCSPPLRQQLCKFGPFVQRAGQEGRMCPCPLQRSLPIIARAISHTDALPPPARLRNAPLYSGACPIGPPLREARALERLERREYLI